MNTAPFRALAATAILASLAGCATSPATPAPSPYAARGNGPAGQATESSATDHSAHGAHAGQPKPAASAHHHHMEGMPPISIPAGALITEADVRFMQGMIAHHAQAVHMTNMAASAGASPRVLKLAQKIDLTQAGEIALMQDWLREYEQFVPDTSSWRGMTMAGMLTDAELARLEQARGTDFDRLFLTLMIRHHEGALTMVADLYASPRSAQEVDISVLANDVETTQAAEIGLMLQMLDDIP